MTTVFQQLKDRIVATGKVSGRVFAMDGVPTTVTFPYASIQALGSATKVVGGDGGVVSMWADQVQVDVVFETGKQVDPSVYRTIMAALRCRVDVDGYQVYFRPRGINFIPPVAGDLSHRYSITLSRNNPMEAL